MSYVIRTKDGKEYGPYGESQAETKRLVRLEMGRRRLPAGYELVDVGEPEEVVFEPPYEIREVDGQTLGAPDIVQVVDSNDQVRASHLATDRDRAEDQLDEWNDAA